MQHTKYDSTADKMIKFMIAETQDARIRRGDKHVRISACVHNDAMEMPLADVIDKVCHGSSWCPGFYESSPSGKLSWYQQELFAFNFTGDFEDFLREALQSPLVPAFCYSESKDSGKFVAVFRTSVLVLSEIMAGYMQGCLLSSFLLESGRPDVYCSDIEYVYPGTHQAPLYTNLISTIDPVDVFAFGFECLQGAHEIERDELAQSIGQ